MSSSSGNATPRVRNSRSSSGAGTGYTAVPTQPPPFPAPLNTNNSTLSTGTASTKPQPQQQPSSSSIKSAGTTARPATSTSPQPRGRYLIQQWYRLPYYCSIITIKRFSFWSIVVIVTVAEACLCAYYPESYVFLAQVILLIIGTFLFSIQICSECYQFHKRILAAQRTHTALPSTKNFHSSNSGQMTSNAAGNATAPSPTNTTATVEMDRKTLILLYVRFFLHRGEYVLDGACLAIGWVFMFYKPGIAVLRCFRVFRLLW